MWSSRALRILATAVVALIVLTGGGDTEPTRPIRLIVPLPAGGAGDIIARLLTEQIGRSEGQTVITENRPGAGSTIGTEAVARAAPDGNTLLINAPYLLIGPQVKKVGYDPLTSFDPICYLVSSPGIIAVNGASPYRTLSDFLDSARAQPGKLTMASVGPATAQHLGLEILKRSAKVDITYLPYTGGAPAINALLGGHVTSIFAEYAPLAEHLKAGTLRALATSSLHRIAAQPSLPTVAESGHPGYEIDLWWGLFSPAGTPGKIRAQLTGWFRAAIQAPDVKAKLAALGFSPVGLCGEEFAALLRKQYQDYGRAILDAKISAE
jgi:tripartite-type tricarboxylate transporter receptor subunit TctC